MNYNIDPVYKTQSVYKYTRNQPLQYEESSKLLGLPAIDFKLVAFEQNTFLESLLYYRWKFSSATYNVN